MARNVTRSTLRSRIRQLADVENSTFVTDSEINGYIDDALAGLYDAVLTSGWGEDYYGTSSSVAIVAGTSSYNLPSDFYKLLSADLLSGGTYYRLPRIPWGEIVDWRNRNTSGLWSAYGYVLRPSTIEIVPTPSMTGSLVLNYVPAPPFLTADSGAGGTVDGVAGWERYLVLRAVADIKVKEQDPGLRDAIALADRELQRIVSSAPVRDVGQPLRIAEVEY